jgi:uncharacterized protein YecE (DUF72 family)
VILFQLPPYLHKDIPLLEAFLTSLPRGMKSAFEFRHESWFGEELFTTLRAQNAALCIADTERLATPSVATANFGYFRLRDTGYTDKDIARWAGAIAEQNRKATDIYVYFKHEEAGVGTVFAKQLMEILGPQAVRSAVL